MKPDLADVLTGVGLVMVAAGCYLVWPPLALLVLGSVLVALGVAGARRN